MPVYNFDNKTLAIIGLFFFFFNNTDQKILMILKNNRKLGLIASKSETERENTYSVCDRFL